MNILADIAFIGLGGAVALTTAPVTLSRINARKWYGAAYNGAALAAGLTLIGIGGHALLEKPNYMPASAPAVVAPR